jgi:hypothetical protein
VLLGDIGTGKPINRELSPKTLGYRYEVMTN